MRKSLAVLAVLAMLAVPAFAAQNRNLVEDQGAPSNFTQVDGDFCSDPNAFIGAGSLVVTDTQTVAGTGETVAGLGVGLQVIHLWVGDLSAELESPNSTTATIMDRPGSPDTPDGCSADDIDATLSDGGSPSVEGICVDPGPPAISGNPAPDPDALAAFAGEDFDGDWTLTLTDNYAAFSDGVFERWCLTNNFDGGDGGDGGTGTPATSTWGVIAMIVLFLAVSLFFLRRRATA
jgi:subtilisin-like proprotein convertase family protein